jgi:carboxypeptidase T
MATDLGFVGTRARLVAVVLIAGTALAASVLLIPSAPTSPRPGGAAALASSSAGPKATSIPTAARGSAAAASVGPVATGGPPATLPPTTLPPTTLPPTTLPACPRETDRFPVGYTGYHTYAALCRALVAAASTHPDIARLRSIGRSVQGRQIWAMEISSHLRDGTHPPGVLFDGLHHALEHLSLEMPLALMGWLLDGYRRDPTITSLVQTRAIFIIFDVNPDGAAFDISGGRFHEWRKNRQSEPGGAVGTDLNRNYANHWGCCGLVSADPASPYYRGVAPFSAPETRAVRDFVRSLVFAGRQEIRAAITFHASGRLVLWPYGYTRSAVPPDMTATDHAVFVALGTHMASLNGYRPEQASSLYVDSGTARDWYYGANHIFAFTFELGSGTYQPSIAIATETERNRGAILYLISMADCPYRAIDKASASCG